MVIVTVELVSGITGERKELGRMTIANDTTGSEDTGHYYGELVAEYGTRRFVRRNFHRKTSSVWTLIGSVLSKLGHAKGVKDVKETTSGKPVQAELFSNQETEEL